MKTRTILALSAPLFAGAVALGSGCGGSDAESVIDEGGGSAATTGGPASGASSTSGSATTGSAGTTGGTGGAGSGSGSGGAGGGGGAPCDTTWYCDGDKDTHGDENASVAACEAPPGNNDACKGPYVDSKDDCAPADANGFPGQTMFFGVPAAPPVYGNLGFDYDCNGKEERDATQLYKGGQAETCGFMECFFNAPKGFVAAAACGSTDNYVECTSNFGQCEATKKPAPEPLRCR